MDGTSNNAGLQTALRMGVIFGICAAAVELYYVVLGLAGTSISQPIYQTLWLLTAFLFALAGIWTVRLAWSSAKNIFDVALFSGVAGAIVGVFYAVAVIVVQLIGSIFYLRYDSLSSILGTVFGIFFSSALWLPAIVAVAVAGGIVYATLTNKI